MGYQKYTWNLPKIRSNEGKYYTYVSLEHRPDKRTPPLVLWGMEYLKEVKACNVLFVVEGVWDAVRCVKNGFPAVAVLTATPDRSYKTWFKLLTMHLTTVCICDNDENKTGLKLAKMTDYYSVCPYPDMNDMPDKEAKEYLEGLYETFRCGS